MGLKILEAWDGLLMGRVEEEVGVGVCVCGWGVRVVMGLSSGGGQRH